MALETAEHTELALYSTSVEMHVLREMCRLFIWLRRAAGQVALSLKHRSLQRVDFKSSFKNFVFGCGFKNVDQTARYK